MRCVGLEGVEPDFNVAETVEPVGADLTVMLAAELVGPRVLFVFYGDLISSIGELVFL